MVQEFSYFHISSQTHYINSIIRQCYNEMSLAFSHTLKLHQKPMTPDNGLNIADYDAKNRRRSSAKPMNVLRLSPAKQSSFVKENQRLSRGAWVCIRAAGVIAKAQQRCELLLGDPSITSLNMDKEVGNQIPDFVLEDMTGVENADQKKDSSSINFILRFNNISSGSGAENHQEATKITWVHVLKYFTHLRRYCSYASLALGNFDKAIVRAHFRSCKRSIKLSAISRYLSENLTVFDKECVPIFPMDLIASLVSSVTNSKRIVSGTDISAPVSPLKMDIQEDQCKFVKGFLNYYNSTLFLHFLFFCLSIKVFIPLKCFFSSLFILHYFYIVLFFKYEPFQKILVLRIIFFSFELIHVFPVEYLDTLNT